MNAYARLRPYIHGGISAFGSAPKSIAVALIVVSCAAIGWVDFVTGAELRIYPLYFFPISIAAWRFGRRAPIGVAAGCTMIWLASNFAAGMYRLPIWIPLTNGMVQFVTFGSLGWLLAMNRALLLRERRLARTDLLSGLLNRRGFHERALLELRRARRTGAPFVLACLDLDHFKAVNDIHGHATGDHLLMEVGAAISGRVRATDVAGRLGGDEFVLLITDTDTRGASDVLEAVRRAIEALAQRLELPVAASIGAIVGDPAQSTFEALLRQADAALYAAKDAGRNRVIVATPTSPAAHRADHGNALPIE